MTKATYKCLVFVILAAALLGLVGCGQIGGAASTTRDGGYLSFFLNDTDVTLTAPETQYTMTYKLQPTDAQIRWSSDDETVATVDESGIVTAVGPGKCNITATVGLVTAEGQDWDQPTTATAVVTCKWD